MVEMVGVFWVFEVFEVDRVAGVFEVAGVVGVAEVVRVVVVVRVAEVVRVAHCSTLKRQLFAASPSLHSFFYFAAIWLAKRHHQNLQTGENGDQKAVWVDQFYYTEVYLSK